MKPRLYNHFNGRALGMSLQIEITDDKANDAKRVTIIAPLYMNKRKAVPFCWSSEYTDADILRDHNLGTFLGESYGQ